MGALVTKDTEKVDLCSGFFGSVFMAKTAFMNPSTWRLERIWRKEDLVKEDWD